MPLDVGRVTHLLEQMHRSEDDAGDPIVVDKVLVTDGAAGFTWEDYGASSGFDPGWYIVTDYGAVGDGTTDDTVAVQDAIDACTTAGGGTVYFPAGIYQISGALQSTGTYNAQLIITTAAAPMAVRFLGATTNKVYGGTPSTGNESVIRSDWNGTISGHPALLSGGTYRSIAQSALYASFENLTIVCPDDPKLTALQMTSIQSVRIRDVQIRTTSAVPSSAPTHATATGYEGPWGLASIVPDYAIGLDIYGFFTGLIPQEQFHGVDIGVAFCNNVMKLIGGQGSPTHTHYPVVITKLVYTWCQYGLVFEDDVRWVQIDMMAVEHDSSPFAPVADIYDPSNFARGFIAYHALAFSGTMEDLIFDGGEQLSTFWGHGKQWTLNNAVVIPEGTDPSTNPPTGFTLYAESGTGIPTTRDDAGGVTALMREGDTAGGDLSGSYPNPAVVDDSHNHSASTAPGASSSGGQILISDTPSTPLVFADLLQNEAQDDLIYSG